MRVEIFISKLGNKMLNYYFGIYLTTYEVSCDWDGYVFPAVV